MNKSKFRFPPSAFCFLLSAFLLFCSLPCSAQNNVVPPLPQSMQKQEVTKRKLPKISVGGGFGVQFGSYSVVEVAPQVGMYVLPWMQVLVNGQYSYIWMKNVYKYYSINYYPSFRIGVCVDL